MRVDLHELMDTYEGSEFEIGNSCDVSAEKIQQLIRTKTVNHHKVHVARIAVIAAMFIICLGTTALATTDLFETVSRFLSSSLDVKFGGMGNDGMPVVATVECGTDMNVDLRSGESVLIVNDDGSWYFSEGQKIEIIVEIETRGVRVEHDPGYAISIGCIRCDKEGNAIEREDIYGEQIFESAVCTYEIPETGYYYFYFQHVSSDPYELDYFTVNIVE